jgi:hypothetical protein
MRTVVGARFGGQRWEPGLLLSVKEGFASSTLSYHEGDDAPSSRSGYFQHFYGTANARLYVHCELDALHGHEVMVSYTPDAHAPAHQDYYCFSYLVRGKSLQLRWVSKELYQGWEHPYGVHVLWDAEGNVVKKRCYLQGRPVSESEYRDATGAPPETSLVTEPMPLEPGLKKEQH